MQAMMKMKKIIIKDMEEAYAEVYSGEPYFFPLFGKFTPGPK